MSFSKWLLAPALCLIGTAWSQDRLAAVGPQYPIAEQDMRDYIQSRLKAMQESGEMARIEKEAKERSIRSIEHPKPVAGLRRAKRNQTHFLDMSVTLDEDVLDGQGQLVAAKGTRINPLEIMPLTQRLLFINGEDPEQVQWALTLTQKSKIRVKTILVQGSPLELGKRWNKPVFFDQGGYLVHRFEIQFLPAKVEQQDLRLRVDEIAL
jgi:conjugal transfer pilus assembly protein TraW